MGSKDGSKSHCPCVTLVNDYIRPVVADEPLGAAKCMTLPSSLNIFTSSMAWMGCTFSFFSEVCNFLSSVPDVLWTFFCFLRGVPLPLQSMVHQLPIQAI